MVTASDDMLWSGINQITFIAIIISNYYDSLTSGEMFGALERVRRTVGRKVNPTVYTVAEFSKRARTENAFVTRVLRQPKLWVIGSEDKLPVAHGGAPSSRTGSRSDDHVGS